MTGNGRHEKRRRCVRLTGRRRGRTTGTKGRESHHLAQLQEVCAGREVAGDLQQDLHRQAVERGLRIVGGPGRECAVPHCQFRFGEAAGEGES